MGRQRGGGASGVSIFDHEKTRPCVFQVGVKSVGNGDLHMFVTGLVKGGTSTPNRGGEGDTPEGPIHKTLDGRSVEDNKPTNAMSAMKEAKTQGSGGRGRTEGKNLIPSGPAPLTRGDRSKAPGTEVEGAVHRRKTIVKVGGGPFVRQGTQWLCKAGVNGVF